MAKHIHNFNEGEVAFAFLIYCVVFVVISAIYSIWWHIKQNNKSFDSAIKHAWLRGILRYFIAFLVSVYGFAKILKTQFAVSYARADTPVGNLSGFELTWNYFGHSYTLAVILGLCQIIGAILLIFRRTTFLGICILLPLMVNVVLINIFYKIAAGAFINSLIITFALIYLLLLRWDDLKAVLFVDNSNLPKIKFNFLKAIAKVITIGAAFGCIYYFVATVKSAPFTGKWKVENLIRNGKQVKSDDWLTNKNTWSNIYIEQWGKIALSNNPYIFDKNTAVWANYSYDAKCHKLTLTLPGYLKNTYTEVVTVSNLSDNNMQWNTIHNNDTLQLKLSKSDNQK
ncbi:MAG: hypothetical protein M3O71_15145 [Bacteroidota bacterium]|nr:hypothetical protein [Bacteroidota bacterium]